ncbi:GNAT family N-acetyltransferase [Streptococcaceae bacterium ESL0687]|nr:GNAT family N-acetyltransferase [Streptococcaceae bacterium ESL0687]
MWKIKKISELGGLDFYHALKLRIDTFIMDQERIYHELDEKDLIAYHIFYQDSINKEVLAYARIFEDGEDIILGRVVTSKSVQAKGWGKKLLVNTLAFAQDKWPNRQISIESQEQVVGFYKKFGFEIEGESFIHEGTPHIKMRYIHEKN